MTETTGINLSHLKDEVVEPALIVLGFNSSAAVNLVTGTALVESRCSYLRQLGSGPALGLWQMEPATESDCWTTYLPYQHELANRIKGLLAPFASVEQRTQQLVWNLMYAAAMCRVKYLRARETLPQAKDARGLAGYHKLVYNSALGAADPVQNTRYFQQAIEA